MSYELDVIIVDDDPDTCFVAEKVIKEFYKWGEVLSFTDIEEASAYCLGRDPGVGIFILDVFLAGKSGFNFLDTIERTFPSAREDTIMITGNASDEVVNRCLEAEVYYLLQKPIRPYALQLAVRAIVTKYIKFAKRMLQDPDFATKFSDNV